MTAAYALGGRCKAPRGRGPTAAYAPGGVELRQAAGAGGGLGQLRRPALEDRGGGPPASDRQRRAAVSSAETMTLRAKRFGIPPRAVLHRNTEPLRRPALPRDEIEKRLERARKDGTTEGVFELKSMLRAYRFGGFEG